MFFKRFPKLTLKRSSIFHTIDSTKFDFKAHTLHSLAFIMASPHWTICWSNQHKVDI
ncbi:hypothetical protein HanPSC8_Chr17g0788201 [Helianthus annuus]|nr:hypothetical protein HanPSC8_Chr17g0788201 [Helianthus annuus]